MKKIFCPDIMFGNTLRSCWCFNIKTIDDKIPINTTLKDKGIFALDITPENNADWWAFGIPINKNWEPQTLKSDNLTFEIVSSDSFNLKVAINNTEDQEIFAKEILIDTIEEWTKKTIELTPILQNARLLLFSGPTTVLEFLIKNIVIN